MSLAVKTLNSDWCVSIGRKGPYLYCWLFGVVCHQVNHKFSKELQFLICITCMKKVAQ